MMQMNEKALSLDPNLVEAQFGIGMVYFHQKRFTKARRSFEKVLESRNDYYDPCYWLGVTLDVLEDHDTAVKYYRSAAAIKPYSEEPWHYLEQHFRRINNLEAAKEAAKKAGSESQGRGGSKSLGNNLRNSG
jgi:tetratricopeptide (TPR) repeat protein